MLSLSKHLGRFVERFLQAAWNMECKLTIGVTLILSASSSVCFAQKSQVKSNVIQPFSTDSLIGTWGNCVTEFDKKTKFRNTEISETMQLTGNTCPEISFNKDSIGSVRTMGANQPPYIKFFWLIKSNMLYVSNRVELQNYKSNYLPNGQYAIKRRHGAIKGIYTQITLTDNRKLRYILTK